MRAAALPVLALPLLLTYCGASGDLVIGKIEPVAEGGASVIPTAGAGGSPTAAGSAQGGAGAVAGSGGDVALGGDAGASGASGAAGAAGAPATVCVGDEEPPLDSLVNRYAFDGTGGEVVDSMGGLPGNLEGGAMLDGTGALTLAGNRDGQPDQYVNLPNDLISSLTDVTFVVWATWKGGAGYERILDFGISDQGEKQGGSGRSYIAVMTSNGFANGMGLGAEITAPGFATLQLASDKDIKGKLSQIALVFRSGVNVELYLDGVLLISSPSPFKLSDIVDVNNWLGESQWSKDHPFGGTYDEFRIYNTALNGCQLTTLLTRGPDVP